MPDHYEKFRKQVKVEIIQVVRLHVRVKGEKKKKGSGCGSPRRSAL